MESTRNLVTRVKKMRGGENGEKKREKKKGEGEIGSWGEGGIYGRLLTITSKTPNDF
jgi:hypothetical protein